MTAQTVCSWYSIGNDEAGCSGCGEKKRINGFEYQNAECEHSGTREREKRTNVSFEADVYLAGAC